MTTLRVSEVLPSTQVIMWSRFVLDRLHTQGWYADTDANKVFDTELDSKLACTL